MTDQLESLARKLAEEINCSSVVTVYGDYAKEVLVELIQSHLRAHFAERDAVLRECRKMCAEFKRFKQDCRDLASSRSHQLRYNEEAESIGEFIQRIDAILGKEGEGGK